MINGKEKPENFDIERYVDSMDAVFDGELCDLDLPADVLKKLAEQEAMKEAANKDDEEAPE